MEKQTASRFGRLSTAEYQKMVDKRNPNLKRISSEEYERMTMEILQQILKERGTKK